MSNPLDRREFIKQSGRLAMGGAAMLLPSAGNSLEPKKPNVLFICVDDLRPELGCFGHEHMHTPHLDRLAREARLFTRHHIQAPSCGPSRYSLLTGRRPRQRAELANDYMEKNFHQQPESKQPETFIHHFRRNGYRTVGIGKVSHTPDGIVRGSDKQYELPHSWNEMLCENEKWGDGFDAFFAYANGESRASMNHEVPPYECADVPDEGYPDGLNAKLAVRKLNELSQQDQPFLLSVGFFKPHLPFNSPKKYWDLYKREEISLSPNPNASDAASRNLLHASGEFFNNYRIQKERGEAGKRIGDDYAREIRHAYFAAVSYIDAQIGKVLQELKNLDLERNTIVVVWSDHGWHLGDHTIWGKHSPFERSTHSPLFIKIPNMINPGSSTKALVETVDIYPTLCELAKLKPPTNLDGKSLTGLLNNPEDKGKKAVYCYQANRISMRTDRYRLIAQHNKGEWTMALFDHQSDPNETRNIAKEKPEVVNTLLPLLNQGNTGIIPKVKLRTL